VAPSGPLIGRWVQIHRCETLVAALNAAGIGTAAPAVIGDYFPDLPPEALAQKPELCAGAEPLRHYHFFDANGRFGSLDHNQQVVDGAPFELVGEDMLRILDITWRYTVEGNRLSLDPVLTEEQRLEAAATPFAVAPAAWGVAVAYPGTTWKRVPCKAWC
jgi:hypothetical protein